MVVKIFLNDYAILVASMQLQNSYNVCDRNTKKMVYPNPSKINKKALCKLETYLTSMSFRDNLKK